jgi:hypothetical protein
MRNTEWVDIMLAGTCDDEDDDDLLLRRLIPCEEDRRRLFPTTTWAGGYRWFRSPNVIDLEAYRSTHTRS